MWVLQKIEEDEEDEDLVDIKRMKIYKIEEDEDLEDMKRMKTLKYSVPFPHVLRSLQNINKGK